MLLSRVQVMGVEEKKWHPGDAGWRYYQPSRNGGLRNPRQRPAEDSSAADACFGDAGGSVWKMWKFRDPRQQSAPS